MSDKPYRTKRNMHSAQLSPTSRMARWSVMLRRRVRCSIFFLYVIRIHFYYKCTHSWLKSILRALLSAFPSYCLLNRRFYRLWSCHRFIWSILFAFLRLTSVKFTCAKAAHLDQKLLDWSDRRVSSKFFRGWSRNGYARHTLGSTHSYWGPQILRNCDSHSFGMNCKNCYVRVRHKFLIWYVLVN